MKNQPTRKPGERRCSKCAQLYPFAAFSNRRWSDPNRVCCTCRPFTGKKTMAKKVAEKTRAETSELCKAWPLGGNVDDFEDLDADDEGCDMIDLPMTREQIQEEADKCLPCGYVDFAEHILRIGTTALREENKRLLEDRNLEKRWRKDSDGRAAIFEEENERLAIRRVYLQEMRVADRR